MTLRGTGPHVGQPVLASGVPLDQARSALVLVHGRGDSASGILQLGAMVAQDGMAYLAPQAAGHTWYPNRFLAPIPSNEPWLSSALEGVTGLLADIEAAGIPGDRMALLGFSQGACLALEFAVRHARRYGALVGLSGGLIGPQGTTWPRTGSLEQTPVFLGCSDVDPHIPVWRFEETASVLRELNGDVRAVLYPGMDHTVSAEEVAEVRRILAPLGVQGGIASH
jgi:predicted esterase